MINHDAIRLLNWYFQQPDIFKKNEDIFSNAPEIIIAPSHKPHPIFNSQVQTVFQRPFSPDETRIDHQIAIHIDRTDTYMELKNHPIIDAYRAYFNCPDSEYYEILDTIFWRLGAMLDEEGLEESPAEWLHSHGLNH